MSVLTVTARVVSASSSAEKRAADRGSASGYAAKVISSLLFCAAGISAVFGKELTLPRSGMLAAFVLALAGDIFLGLGPFTKAKHSGFLFALGSVPFLLAQILYIAVLMSLAPLNPALVPIAAALPIFYLALIARGTLAYLCKNTVPILFYSVIMGVMVMAAVNAFAAGCPAGVFAFPAGVLFALSDTSLFLYNFGNDSVRSRGKLLTALVMLPYYAAQALFAIALSRI
jgi:uncharacterized membrane protein YhhN